LKGVFITFEGTEGGGKSTQIARLAERLKEEGKVVRVLREPGGTPIGEEIRHTLKHSSQNAAMTPEAELLLMCASRAQLVREVIRPALVAGEVVLCDRFYDSTEAYQGYGRGLDTGMIKLLKEFVVGSTHPQLTLLLNIPLSVSKKRRDLRASAGESVRDRMEEADASFFNRVEQGFLAIAAGERGRVKVVDGTMTEDLVAEAIWRWVGPLIETEGFSKH